MDEAPRSSALGVRIEATKGVECGEGCLISPTFPSPRKNGEFWCILSCIFTVFELVVILPAMLTSCRPNPSAPCLVLMCGLGHWKEEMDTHYVCAWYNVISYHIRPDMVIHRLQKAG